jgi:hypothetical protein
LLTVITNGIPSESKFVTVVGIEAPTNLTATAVSASQIDLAWQDNSPDENGFVIERKSGAGAWAQVGTVGVGVTTYSNVGLSASTGYTYRISAFNPFNTSPTSNEASATTTACTAITISLQPQSQTIQSGQSAMLSVSATGNEPLSYQWFQQVSGGGFITVQGATSNSLTTGPLTATSVYKVRVTDACGTIDTDPATVTVRISVTSTANAGAGSLRDAIDRANLGDGLKTIFLEIPGSGPHTINLTAPLAAITKPVVLDGITLQSGAAVGRPVVVLSGPGAGPIPIDCTSAGDAAASFDGLHFAASAAGSVVRGLVINRMPGDGIEFEGGGSAQVRSRVESCYVGTDVSGAPWFGALTAYPFSNGRHGVFLNGAAYVIVGGDRAPDASLRDGNLISGNRCSGVEVRGGLALRNEIRGSNIGPDVSGRFPIGNGTGIHIEDAPSTVVGAAGDDASKRNRVGYNSGGGVVTQTSSTSPDGAPLNTVVLGTTFTDNGGMGAIFGGAGTPPVLASASITGTTLLVTGTATGLQPSAQYRVQYFSSTTCSAGGQGEVLIAANVLKQSNPTGELDLTFASSATTVRPGELVSVTVTDEAGNIGTSDFSSCEAVEGRLAVVAERGAVVSFAALPASGAGGAVEQGAPGGGSGGTPGLDRTFAGPRNPATDAEDVTPADPQAAVGASHLVAVTNAEVVVQSRTDGAVTRRVALDTFWSALKRTPGEVLFAFNPRAVYDALGSRYIVVAVANPREANSAVLFAVSRTTDPMGEWNLYRYDAEGADVLWADYLTLGYNAKWIGVQVNMSSVAFANVIVRSEVYLIDKAVAYAGVPGTGKATVLGRRTNDSDFGATQMPAVTLDAATEDLWLAQTGSGSVAGLGRVRTFKVSGPVGQEALTIGPEFTTSDVWFTNQLPFVDFAPQLWTRGGTARKLQVNDTRMQSVVYRNGRLYLAHTVLLPYVEPPTLPTYATVQWWEVNPNGPSGAPLQRNVVEGASASQKYAHPSLAVTAGGAVVVSYTKFTSAGHASAAYRYRAAADAPGSLRGEVVLKAGESEYYKTLGGEENRWGDYSAAASDPVEGERVWLLNSYAETPRSGTSGMVDQWGTWWGSIAGAGCTSSQTAITAGQTMAGSLAATDCFGTVRTASYYDRFTFTGQVGRTYYIEMGSAAFDTYLVVKNAAGQVVAEDDNTAGGTTALVRYTATAAGTYTVEATSAVAAATGSYSIRLAQRRVRTSTTGVFRPSNAILYLKNQNTSGFADIFIPGYGLAGDVAVVGDWNGDGVDTIGVFRSGTFFLRNSNNSGFGDITVAYGQAGDLPVVGDWDGDGIDTVGFYRGGAFYLRNTNTTGDPQLVFSLGNPGDVPIAGDWNRDGIDTVGVFRPSNAILYLKNTNVEGFADVFIPGYGIAGDAPVTGDWNGDGTDTIGVYRGGTFFLRNTNDSGFADLTFALGIPGDAPLAGDWDGLP